MATELYATTKRPKQSRAAQFVSYVRQGRNGRGAKIQQAGVRRVLAYYRQDEPVELLATYTDPDQPGQYRELQRAIRRAERTGAILIVGRLGRLRNDPQFLGILFRSGVRVAFGDAAGVGCWTLGAILLVAHWKATGARWTARRESLASLVDLLDEPRDVCETAEILNSQGSKTLRGRRWTMGRVFEALRNARREAEQIAVAG